MDVEVQEAEMISNWIHAKISEVKNTNNPLRTASTAMIIEIEMAVATTMITEI